jgi:hypothetical protein
MYRPQIDRLIAVAARSITFSVFYTSASIAQPVCEWDFVPTPSPGSGSNVLTGVAAVSSEDVYALGSNSAGPFIIRWDGIDWTELWLPVLGGDYDLRAIGAVAGRIYLAGVMPTGAFTSSQVLLSLNGTE